MRQRFTTTTATIIIFIIINIVHNSLFKKMLGCYIIKSFCA